MKKFIILLMIVSVLSIPANAMTTGHWDVGTVQDSVGNAVEQEVEKNPNWLQDWFEQLMAEWGW